MLGQKNESMSIKPDKTLVKQRIRFFILVLLLLFDNSSQNLNIHHQRAEQTGEAAKNQESPIREYFANLQQKKQATQHLSLIHAQTNCYIGCQTCQSPAMKDCLSCSVGYFLINGECLAFCPLGYFKDSVSQKCEECPMSCNFCVNKDVCYTCIAHQYLFNKKCGSDCPEGYFRNDATNSCDRCHGLCKSCFGEKNTQCRQCRWSALYDGQNSCNLRCSSGMYMPDNTMASALCIDPCKECFDGQSNTCWDCNQLEGYQFNSQTYQCLKNCPESTFFDPATNQCVQCHGLCFSCTGSLPTQCTQCLPGVLFTQTKTTCSSSCQAALNIDINNQQCVQTCPPQTFLQQAAMNICVNCDPTCESCQGPSDSDCESCPPNKFLYLKKCVDKCPDIGFFSDKIQKQCSPCFQLCKSCIDGGAETQCKDCIDGYVKGSTDPNSLCCAVNGFFYDGVAQQCTACNPSCQTCQGPLLSDCLACADTFSLYQNALCCKTGTSFYANIKAGTCDVCNSSCQSCKGPLLSDCVTCADTFQLFQNALCCKSGTSVFANTQTGTCDVCHASCKTCQGPNLSDCLTCSDGFSLFNNLLCCKTGTNVFANSKTGTCDACDPTCDGCIGSLKTDCSNCANQGVQFEGVCCPSVQGYYVDQKTKICEKCNASCDTCTGPNSNECLTCIGAFVKTAMDSSQGGGNMCCQDKPGASFYSDPQTKECQICDSVCQSCFGPNPYDCKTCQDGYVSLEGLCCPNADRYYGNQATQTCDACSPRCQGCQGPNEFDCIDCVSGSVLIQKTICCDNVSYYFDQINQQCAPCSASCKTCIGPQPNMCSDCKVGIRVGQLCCTSQQFFQNERNECQSCDPQCDGCKSQKQCDGCSGLNVQVGTFCCPNATEYYFDPTAIACMKCHENCDGCTGPLESQCNQCKPNTTKMGNLCCQPQFYSDGKSTSCLACHHSCKFCSGPNENQCTQCDGSYVPMGQVSGSTTFMCCLSKENNYPDPVAGKCGVCAESCSGCTGPKPNQCVACKANTTKMGNLCCQPDSYPIPKDDSCMPCNKNCQGCTGPLEGECQQCANGFYKAGNTFCCPTQSFYADTVKKICSACNRACLKCIGPTENDCLGDVCKEGFIKNTNTADPVKTICCEEYQFYFDSKQNSCQQCDVSCLQCKGPATSDCTVCPHNSLERDENDKKYCDKACNQGFFADQVQKVCVPCFTDCNYCSGPQQNECINCKPGQFLDEKNHTCVETCPAGTYQEPQISKCLICNSLCQTCKGPEPSQCIKCLKSFKLDNQCVQACPAGYYSDLSDLACKVCNKECQTCNGPDSSQCLSCPPGLLYDKDSTTCTQQCPKGTFPDSNSQTCTPCDNTCLTCTAAGNQKCVECKPPYVKVSDLCQKGCQEGLFMDKSSNTCKNCDQRCSTCFGPSYKECITCKEGYQLDYSSCI